jgi:uncharacterized protein
LLRYSLAVYAADLACGRPRGGGAAIWEGGLEQEGTMALELRPNCEFCDKDLPPASSEARICTYECTFCADCVERELQDVCPNCGGGFTPRPIRPATEWRPGLSLAKRPASEQRVHLSYAREDIAELSARLKDIPPAER